MRGSRAISLLITIGLLALVLTACSNETPSAPDAQPSSEEATPTVSSDLVNACTYDAPESTPTPTLTPNADSTRPTSTPFPTPTPEEPSAEVVAYPDLTPRALPAAALESSRG